MHHRLALRVLTLGLFAAACGGSSDNEFGDGTGGWSGNGWSGLSNGGSAGHGASGGGAGSSGTSTGTGGTSPSAGASTGGSGGSSGSAGESAVAGSSGAHGGAAGAGAGGAAAGTSSSGASGISGGGGMFGLGGRTGMGGRFGGGGRAQGGMGGLGFAGMAGMGVSGMGTSGAGGASGCPASGHVSYTLTKNANPTADEQQAYMLITEAMDKAVQYYNCYTNITKADTVTYVPSVETADGNSNGSIRFGGKDYMEYVTAMHEIAHTVGIGTASNWGSMVSNGIFTGDAATAKLRSITGVADDQVHADTQHFWPYGLNYTSEVKSEADVIDHCYMVVAIRADLGLH